jgi:ADP-heptose:LPS heptosyltransferase
MPLRDSAGCNDGVLSLAGVISQLDLVITVDTLAAHLAGSLGVPVWLLLQYAADWRWMDGRNDSPWYPSLRIFRQTAPGEWLDVVEAVERKLQQWARATDRARSA